MSELREECRPMLCLLVVLVVSVSSEVALDIYPKNKYGLSYISQNLQCVCRHDLIGYDNVLPKWKINGETYLSTGLPLVYRPQRREQFYGISFQSSKEFNGTTIACCYLFSPYIEDTCSKTYTVNIADHLSIIDHPRNQTAEEGDMVKMDCGYVGTGALPLWNINGIIFLSTSLPIHFTALRDGLQFKAILALDGVEFQCFFQGITDTKSNIGRIYVQKGLEMENNTMYNNLMARQPMITGFYLDQDPTLYNVYWKSYKITLNHTIFSYITNCEVKTPLTASSTGNNPISLNNTKIPIAEYLFQLQDSSVSNHSTLFKLFAGDKGVWYHNQTDTFNISFNRQTAQEVCIVDLMQSVEDVCSFTVEGFPPPFKNCSNDTSPPHRQVCANVDQLKNMTLFTIFEGSDCCPNNDAPPCSKAISSHLLFVIGPPLRPPKPCAYVDSQSNAILCFQHPYTHPKSPISSYSVSIGNSNELYKHILSPSEVCQPFPIPSDLTLPLNFSVSAMNGAGYNNESEYTTVEDKLNEDLFCSCLASEFDIPVHLRVSDTTVEISHDELQPNFPDALQIDVCNATLHLMKNAEDVQPHTVLDSCNSSSVSLQLKDLSPDTNSIVFARIVLRIIGTDLTCNLTTNSAQLVSDPDSSGTNYVMIMVGITTAIFFIVKVLHRCCIAIILLNGNIIRGRSYSEKRTEITISIQQCEFLSVPS